MKDKINEPPTMNATASVASAINLDANWLRAAGFAPGTVVELTAISPGVIEIRICPPIQRDQTALEIMARIDGAMAKTEIEERGEK